MGALKIYPNHRSYARPLLLNPLRWFKFYCWVSWRGHGARRAKGKAQGRDVQAGVLDGQGRMLQLFRYRPMENGPLLLHGTTKEQEDMPPGPWPRRHLVPRSRPSTGPGDQDGMGLLLHASRGEGQRGTARIGAVMIKPRSCGSPSRFMTSSSCTPLPLRCSPLWTASWPIRSGGRVCPVWRWRSTSAASRNERTACAPLSRPRCICGTGGSPAFALRTPGTEFKASTLRTDACEGGPSGS